MKNRRYRNPDNCAHRATIPAIDSNRRYCVECGTWLRQDECATGIPDPRDLPSVVAAFEEHAARCDLRHTQIIQETWNGSFPNEFELPDEVRYA